MSPHKQMATKLKGVKRYPTTSTHPLSHSHTLRANLESPLADPLTRVGLVGAQTAERPHLADITAKTHQCPVATATTTWQPQHQTPRGIDWVSDTVRGGSRRVLPSLLGVEEHVPDTERMVDWLEQRWQPRPPNLGYHGDERCFSRTQKNSVVLLWLSLIPCISFFFRY